MSYKSKSLHQLIEEAGRTLFLPHIQRPFVWEEGQMIRLLDSLMRGYPIQTFLFWRTKEQIKARRFMDTVDRDLDLHDLYSEPATRQGFEKVFVLDGQQRLQSLFAIFQGRLAGSPAREAWIDLTAGTVPDEDGLVHRIKFVAKQPGETWYRISDLMGRDAKKNAADIADDLVDAVGGAWPDAERRVKERAIRRNMQQLAGLLKHTDHFWYDELDGVAEPERYTYRCVLDIFVRVNSGGTKLDASDLMFAAMKEMSEDIEQDVEEIADLLNEGDLAFDKSWVLKALVVAHDRKAELGPELFAGGDGAALMKAISNDWSRAEAAFQELKDFLTQDLAIRSDRFVKSYGSLIPLFDFLYHNPKPNQRLKPQMVAYFHKAQLFNWFGASTDTIINAMHKLFGKTQADFPLAEAKDYFRGRGREVEVTPENATKSRAREMVLNIVYREKFGASAHAVHFPGNQPHIDHIFPKTPLGKPTAKGGLGLGSEEINHLGNYRFLGATDNIRKRAQLPASYFADLKAAKVPVEKHLLVEPYASDPAKLAFDVDTYRAFRDARLDEILKLLRTVVDPEAAPAQQVVAPPVATAAASTVAPAAQAD